MTCKVRNGYSPEDLEKWEKRDRKYQALLTFVLLGISLIVFIIGFNGYDGRDNPIPTDRAILTAIGSIPTLCVGCYIAMVHDAHFRFRKKVIKALAALELHVVQCDDDLVIFFDIEREWAEKIIDGQYDDYMRSDKFCKYMPY